jgi:hypothetical protein
MAYTRTIMCLAASRKHGGYCFAGKDLRTGEWIRPVSNRPGEEISDAERTMADGQRAGLLDVLEISFLCPVARDYQAENHLIDPTRKWKKNGQCSWEDVERLFDAHKGPLWLNGQQSWGYRNNRLRHSQAKEFDRSLLLIRPQKLTIGIGPKGGSYPDAEKRLVKAHFSYNGLDYTLAVTDPVIDRRFKAGANRMTDMTGAVLCVSLGEVYKGDAYKLVAAVIEP